MFDIILNYLDLDDGRKAFLIDLTANNIQKGLKNTINSFQYGYKLFKHSEFHNDILYEYDSVATSDEYDVYPFRDVEHNLLLILRSLRIAQLPDLDLGE